jgi:hypothetical protein
LKGIELENSEWFWQKIDLVGWIVKPSASFAQAQAFTEPSD